MGLKRGKTPQNADFNLLTGQNQESEIPRTETLPNLGYGDSPRTSRRKLLRVLQQLMHGFQSPEKACKLLATRMPKSVAATPATLIAVRTSHWRILYRESMASF